MKKRLSFLIALLLLCAAIPAHASDIDLSGLSFGELVALRDRIDITIWESREWQEVTVPQGVYIVGEDIPAGHWTIRPAEGQWASVYWGDKLDESGRDLSYESNIFVIETLTSKSNGTYSESDKTEVDFVLKDGQYIIINNGNTVFTPYSGKPSLGFK